MQNQPPIKSKAPTLSSWASTEGNILSDLFCEKDEKVIMQSQILSLFRSPSLLAFPSLEELRSRKKCITESFSLRFPHLFRNQDLIPPPPLESPYPEFERNFQGTLCLFNEQYSEEETPSQEVLQSLKILRLHFLENLFSFFKVEKPSPESPESIQKLSLFPKREVSLDLMKEMSFVVWNLLLCLKTSMSHEFINKNPDKILFEKEYELCISIQKKLELLITPKKELEEAFEQEIKTLSKKELGTKFSDGELKEISNEELERIFKEKMYMNFSNGEYEKIVEEKTSLKFSEKGDKEIIEEKRKKLHSKLIIHRDSSLKGILEDIFSLIGKIYKINPPLGELKPILECSKLTCELYSHNKKAFEELKLIIEQQCFSYNLSTPQNFNRLEFEEYLLKRFPSFIKKGTLGEVYVDHENTHSTEDYHLSFYRLLTFLDKFNKLTPENSDDNSLEDQLIEVENEYPEMQISFLKPNSTHFLSQKPFNSLRFIPFLDLRDDLIRKKILNLLGLAELTLTKFRIYLKAKIYLCETINRRHEIKEIRENLRSSILISIKIAYFKLGMIPLEDLLSSFQKRRYYSDFF